MKFTKFILLLSLFSLFSLQAQSLSDLKDIEKLKKEFEKLSELKDENGEAVAEAKSLQTFNDSLSIPPELLKTALDEPVIAGEIKDIPKEDKSLKLFGSSVFENAKVDYHPEVYGPVDEDYPLGPGDEIIITVWGEVELRHELTINREGQVHIDNVGMIKLSGLSLGKAEKKLKQFMGRSYSSIQSGKAYLDIALGKLRSIRLYVAGSVHSPGVFTVPALTSVFNMLFYAGGIDDHGSFRNIQIIRSNRVVQSLDFYEFITTGKINSNFRLQTHDVIMIPPAGKRVHLSGMVKRPAIYELKEDEGLTELIDFTGGFPEDAYIETIQIERYFDHQGKKLINVNYYALHDNKTNFILNDGDRINVERLDRDITNIVEISGPVYGPNKFEYYPGLTIAGLFMQVDSIAGHAYLERVQITRKLDDGKTQLYSINLRDFLEDDNLDFPLAPQDRIKIHSQHTLFPPDSVIIFGAVNNPGKFLLKKEMTLKDLIFASGGFTENALISEAEVSRISNREQASNKIATILHVKIDSNYTKALDADDSELFFLEPNDHIFIRSNSEWQVQRNISLTGEVVRPGIYTLQSKTERISDLIKRAGGIKKTAYLGGGKLYRTADGVGQIGINFEKIYNDPASEENIFLQSGDRIFIPERLVTVKIVGGVNFPSSVLYEQGASLDYYIQAAGGYIELADEDNTTIRLANGRPLTKKHFLFWEYLGEDITAGSTIYVPVLAESDDIDWSGAIRDAAAILASVATVLLIYDSVNK